MEGGGGKEKDEIEGKDDLGKKKLSGFRCKLL